MKRDSPTLSELKEQNEDEETTSTLQELADTEPEQDKIHFKVIYLRQNYINTSAYNKHFSVKI
jgi:hypothetical protein